MRRYILWLFLSVWMLAGCTQELWTEPLKKEAVEVGRVSDRIRFLAQTPERQIVLGGEKMYYLLDSAGSRKLQPLLAQHWQSGFRVTDGRGGAVLTLRIKADEPDKFRTQIALHYQAADEPERKRLRGLYFVAGRNRLDDFINSYGLNGMVFSAPETLHDTGARAISIPVEVVYETTEVRNPGAQIQEKIVLTPFALLLDLITLPLIRQEE